MKNYVLFGMVFLGTLVKAQMPTGYCVSGFNSTQYISNVKFGTINNSSVYSSMKNGYTDYTNLSTSLVPGSQNNQLIVTTSNQYNMYENLYVWLDVNRDGYFSDVERIVKMENLPTTNVSVITASFTVPANVSFGKTRIRITMMSRLSYPGEPPLYDGTVCGDLHLTDGETEDYAVTMCPVISIGGQTSGCAFSTFTFTGVGGASKYSWGICSTPIIVSTASTYSLFIPRPGTKCIPLTATFTNGCPTQMKSLYVAVLQCKMGDSEDPELISSRFADDVLKISNPGKDALSIQVISTEGRLITATESLERFINIDMTSLSSGIYLVSVAKPDGVHITQKVSLNR